MFCKYCGNDSGGSDICSKCSEKINNFTQNKSDGKDISNNQGYNWYKEQLENSEEKEKPVEYKGFWTFPRILSIVAAILFTFCCIMPQYLIDDVTMDLAIADIKPNGGYVFVIPILIILNTIFDKSIVTVSLSGFHFRFLRHKLCIIFGAIGICTLFVVPYAMSTYGIIVTDYTPWFYVSVISCLLAIAAPFFVRANDGTGIKPIRKYDYIWIVIVAVLTVALCYNAINKQVNSMVADNNNNDILAEYLEGDFTFDETNLMGCTYNGNDTVVVELVMTNNTSESLRFDDTFELKLFELGAEKSKVTIGSDFPIPDVYGKDMSLQTIESQYPAAIFNAFTVDDISNTFVVEVVSKYDESNVVFTTSDTPYKTAYYESNDEYYAGDEPVYDSSYYDEANDELSDEDMYQVIESFMNEYCSSMVAAINYNDYSLVSPYIGSGSLLEESQKKLIESLNEKGISEEFEGISIDYVEYDEENDNLYIYVTETETIYYPMSEPETKTYNWIYTMNGYEDYIWLTNIE